MSFRISVGTYVATNRPVASGLGFWVGKVIKSNGNGFPVAEVLLADGPTGREPVSFGDGSRGKDHNVVGFRTFKEAFNYRRKKKRAFDFDRQFAQ